MPMKLYTTRQVAERFGYSVDNAIRLAHDRGIKPAMIAGRSYLWSEKDLPKFTPGPNGVRRDLMKK